MLPLLASLLLAACGGSSKSTTTTTAASASLSAATRTSTSTAATTSTATSKRTTARPSTATSAKTSTTAKAARAEAKRFAALRQCLQKNGITLPKHTSGAEPSAHYKAALAKCGGALRGRFAGATTTRRFASPQAKQALKSFAACLRADGIHVPEPNTSGKGPLFDGSNLDTTSPKFAAAETKCRGELAQLFPPKPQNPR